MKIIVCGGRSYNDYRKVCQVLDDFNQVKGITMIIHGDATGADSLAKRWALEHEIAQVPYPARWDDLFGPNVQICYSRSGKPYNALAGILRNQQMLEQNPDVAEIISFPGGRGTKDMVQRAKKKGLIAHVF